MIGITVGEYFGIGPEILLKTYADLQHEFPECKIYGSAQLLEKKADELKLPRFWEENSFELIETYPPGVQKGDTKSRAEFVLSTLNHAIDDAVSGTTSAIVTCPIDKSVIQFLLPTFTGHTEYLAEKSGVSKTVMLLNNQEFSIALLSNHISLRHVSEFVSATTMYDTIQIAAKSFARHFHIGSPKIAVLGMNPHAGELDQQSEEKITFETDDSEIEE